MPQLAKTRKSGEPTCLDLKQHDKSHSSERRYITKTLVLHFACCFASSDARQRGKSPSRSHHRWRVEIPQSCTKCVRFPLRAYLAAYHDQCKMEMAVARHRSSTVSSVPDVFPLARRHFDASHWRPPVRCASGPDFEHAQERERERSDCLPVHSGGLGAGTL